MPSGGPATSSVRIAGTEDEIRSCYPVMRQLRAHHAEDEFIAQVVHQQRDGYRLAYLTAAGQVVAVAGFRISMNLAWGKHMYVDDLVTDERHRSEGCGGRLMDWLVRAALDAGCRELHLDSGVQRFAAHRFYLRHGMDIVAHHFGMRISEGGD